MANDRQELQELEELDALENKAKGSTKPPSLNPINPPFPVPRNQQMRPADVLDGKTKQPSIEAPKDQGLVGNIQRDVQNRFNTGVDIMKSDQNPLSKGLQMGGKVVAGTANDIMGEAAKSAYKASPDIGQWKEKIQGGVQKAMASPLGQAGLKIAQKSGLEYANWAKDHPEAAGNIESLVDIATVLPSSKVAGVLGSAAVKATPIVGPISKGIDAGKTLEKVVPPQGGTAVNKIVDSLHKRATQTIEAAKNSGINFKPQDVTTLTNKLDNINQLKTAGERAKETGTVDLLDQMKNSVLGPLNKKTGIRDASKADTSLRNLIGWSDSLRPLGKKESSAVAAKKIIEDFIGDKGDYPQFKKQWGRYKTGQQAADAAELADESPAKSRAAFSKIMDSKYFSSLSPQLQKSIKIASKGKASGKFMDAVGSIKGLIGAGVEAGAALYAGHPVGLAAIAGSLAANKGGKLVQRGLGGDVLNTLQSEK